MFILTLPEEAQARIRQELRAGESLRWAETPKPKFFTSSTLPMVLFAIPWTAFSIFWMCGAAGFKVPDFSGPGSFFPLFGLPFFFIGMGMLLSPLFHYRRMKKTIYAVTNYRALIISSTIRSFYKNELGSIVRKNRRDGRGDVIFSSEVHSSRNGTHRVDIGFINITNPREVEGHLHRVEASATN